MPASKNILGPDPARGAVSARPAKTTLPIGLPYWFNVCSNPSDPNQTKITADCLNDILGTLREAIASSGAVQDEDASDSDQMISEALARYASLAVSGTAAGSANAVTVSALGGTIVPKALFDGMMVETVPLLTNTSADVTAVVFSLDSKKVLRFDGSRPQPGDLKSGVRTAWVYSAAAASGSGAWLITPWALALIGLDRLPIYPEIDTAGNTLAVTATTGQVVVNADQVFRHRGHRVVNTSDVASGARTFSTAANKTYHLRWTWSGSSGAYSLVDMTAASPAEDNRQYDSTYDMMLIARVVTNGANLPTVTILKNKHDLNARGELLFTDVTWSGDLVAPSALAHGTLVTLDWGRRARAAMAMMTSISTVNGSDTLTTQQLNVGVDSRSRHALVVTYQKTQNPQTGYVSYEAWA